MFKKKIKIETPKQTRIEIIHDNFFKFLKEKKITQKKYSIDNNIPESTISKWKSCTSNMNEEHIVQAAKYFKISVNMLYYTEQELKEISVLDDPKYDPIIAQQQICVDMLDEKFENTNVYLIVMFVIELFFFLLWFMLRKFGDFVGLLVIFIPFVGLIAYRSFMTYKRTFIINYLDQIYYEVENVENKHFWKILSLKIINSLINFLLIIVLLIFNPGYRFHDLELFVILISVLPAAHSFFNVFEIRRKIEKRIDSYDVDGYTSSLKTYVWNIFYSSLLFLLVVYDFKYYWFLIIFMIILPLIAAIESILVNKKFSEYKLLYYNQAEDKHRELFKK